MRLSPYFLAAIVLFCGCARREPAGKTDGQRMKDVHTIATVIEQYKRKTGRYPYAEHWDNPDPNMVIIPVEVIICSRPLPREYERPPEGLLQAMIKYSDFLEYLRKVLGPDLTLPEDDRDPATWVPYQVRFDKDNYFVGAHLTHANGFTRPVDGAFKYQVGSIGSEAAKVRAYSDIAP